MRFHLAGQEEDSSLAIFIIPSCQRSFSRNKHPFPPIDFCNTSRPLATLSGNVCCNLNLLDNALWHRGRERSSGLPERVSAENGISGREPAGTGMYVTSNLGPVR